MRIANGCLKIDLSALRSDAFASAPTRRTCRLLVHAGTHLRVRTGHCHAVCVPSAEAETGSRTEHRCSPVYWQGSRRGSPDDVTALNSMPGTPSMVVHGTAKDPRTAGSHSPQELELEGSWQVRAGLPTLMTGKASLDSLLVLSDEGRYRKYGRILSLCLRTAQQRNHDARATCAVHTGVAIVKAEPVWSCCYLRCWTRCRTQC